ncbi:hypothetical protein HYT52_00195 [Candidatus Woesearchaeota archaeon]|nr:hypothetical protein [Candidatus Woesearchaeota archaeon]
MIISFFEEFPTKKNLTKLNLISFPTKLYLAAKSLKEFKKSKLFIQQLSKNKNILEIIYWPILEKKEGYWVSPFSKRKALQRIFQEIQENNSKKQKPVPLMLDLELPTRHNPRLYLTELLNFYRNKKMIKSFIQTNFNDVYLAEYYPCGKKKEKLLELLGLHYKHAKVIKMAYHSLHRFNQEQFSQLLKKGKEQFNNNYLVAFGTIAKGIDQNEPMLSLEQLATDLKIAQEAGIKEVVIFRLGGLNKTIVKTIEKFV